MVYSHEAQPQHAPLDELHQGLIVLEQVLGITLLISFGPKKQVPERAVAIVPQLQALELALQPALEFALKLAVQVVPVPVLEVIQVIQAPVDLSRALQKGLKDDLHIGLRSRRPSSSHDVLPKCWADKKGWQRGRAETDLCSRKQRYSISMETRANSMSFWLQQLAPVNLGSAL